MKDYLSNLNEDILQVIKRIGQQAESQGMCVYLVGGCVRDIFLGKKILDFDIVVEGDAISLGRELEKKMDAKLSIYKQFGTATMALRKDWRIDLATARQEHYPYAGALPVVKAGNLRGDLLRRDFTINAMAISINQRNFGQLFDIFNGLTDLKNKTIRILHDQSFIDDPTRILRAIRFEQRFGFKMDLKTLRLLKSALQKDMPQHVKPPRYFVEFKKMLMESNPSRPLRRLAQLNGVRFLGSHFKIDFSLIHLIERHISEVEKKILYKTQKDWSFIFIMALWEKAKPSQLRQICKRFHFTRKEKMSILQSHKALDIIEKLSIPQLLPHDIYKILKGLNDMVTLYLRVRTSRKIVCQRIDHFLRRDCRIKLDINGRDLKTMGLSQNEKMGQVLQEILYRKIDKELNTKQEQLQVARLLISKK